MPTQSLRWIDRRKRRAEVCNDTVQALLNLGAISHTSAAKAVGSDTFLYFEGKPDQNTFQLLMQRCGHEGLIGRSHIGLLGGCGDVDKLPGVRDVLTNLKKLKIAIAAILDADYTSPEPKGDSEITGGVLVIHLPCKELENLLLLQPEAIARAAAHAAERRGAAVKNTTRCPTTQDISSTIDDCTGAEEVREAIHDQWLYAWRQKDRLDYNDLGQLKKAKAEFQVRWDDPQWRRRCCPGKRVLSAVRRRIQEEYKLSVGLALAFKYYEPSDELRNLLDELNKHVEDQVGPVPKA